MNRLLRLKLILPFILVPFILMPWPGFTQYPLNNKTKQKGVAGIPDFDLETSGSGPLTLDNSSFIIHNSQFIIRKRQT